MSDEVEQIPMPEMTPQRPQEGPPPPESFTRQLSPEEERNVLLQFMGTQYGELNKLDGNIIGGSNTLQRGKSEEVKQQITQLVEAAVPPAPPPPPPPPLPSPAPAPSPGNLSEAQPSNVSFGPPENDNQLTFNFDINEKDLLFNKIDKLTSKVDNLGYKIDKIFEIINTSKSKSSVKKKTVENNKKS